MRPGFEVPFQRLRQKSPYPRRVGCTFSFALAPGISLDSLDYIGDAPLRIDKIALLYRHFPSGKSITHNCHDNSRRHVDSANLTPASDIYKFPLESKAIAAGLTSAF